MFCSIINLDTEKLLVGKIVAVDLYCGAKRNATVVEMIKAAILAMIIGLRHLISLINNCSDELLMSIWFTYLYFIKRNTDLMFNMPVTNAHNPDAITIIIKLNIHCLVRCNVR